MIPIASPQVGERELEQVREVLESGSLAGGPKVEAFEEAFAEHCEVDHGIATANGTAALQVALHTLGIGEGDRVVTTPFSFVATANAVRLVGAEPVFADIDPRTYNVDPVAVETIARERNVDAILAVHLYGLPAAMDELTSIASEHDLALIEDAAQAHGATFGGRPVGSFGDAACFSFYPTKNATTGEGGMVVTDRADVAERARAFVDHGRSDRYTHETVGHNLRLSDVAAAIGLAQLERLPSFLEARRANAARLSAALEDTEITAPVEPAGTRHAYNQFTVRCPDRDGLQAHLADWGVDSTVYYPTPIHEQPAYRKFDVSASVAERAAEEVLSIPVHPGLDEENLDTIEAALAAYEPPPGRNAEAGRGDRNHE